MCEGLGSDGIEREPQVPIHHLGILRQVLSTVQGFPNLYKEVLAPRPRVWWEANCDKACKAPTSQLVPNEGQFTFEQPWSPSGARTSYTGDDREMTQTCSESQEWGPTFISIMGIVQAECADSGTAGGRRKKQPSAAEVE